MAWSILGSISNAIAAICAVVAICVTVRNFKSDREEQKKEKLSFKFSELYKQAIIDTVLKIEDEKIRYINDKLYKMMSVGVNGDIMKELSETMMSDAHECLMEVEIIRFFSKELWREAKQITEQFCRHSTFWYGSFNIFLGKKQQNIKVIKNPVL